MMPDVVLPAGVWSDVYASTVPPTPVGTALLIYNNGGSVTTLWEGNAQPAADARDGVPVDWVFPSEVAAGSPGCWVYSMAQIRLSVQVDA